MRAKQDSFRAMERDPSRVTIGAIAGAIVAALIASYAAVHLQPRLIDFAEPLRALLGMKPGVAFLAITLASVLASAVLSWLMLSALLRAVQVAPYRVSAPLLLGAAAAMLTQLHVPPPLPSISLPAFACGSSLLMLVGGALLQLDGTAPKVAGTLVLSFPLLALIGADSTSLDGASQIGTSYGGNRSLVSLLSVTSIATFALARVSRSASVPPASDRSIRNSAASPLQSSAELTLGAVVLVLIAVIAFGYSGVYVPLVRKLKIQEQLLSDDSQKVAAVVPGHLAEPSRVALTAPPPVASSRLSPPLAASRPAATQVPMPRGESAAPSAPSRGQSVEHALPHEAPGRDHATSRASDNPQSEAGFRLPHSGNAQALRAASRSSGRGASASVSAHKKGAHKKMLGSQKPASDALLPLASEAPRHDVRRAPPAHAHEPAEIIDDDPIGGLDTP